MSVFWAFPSALRQKPFWVKVLYSIVEIDEKLQLTVLLCRPYFLPMECSCELYVREE